MDKEEIKNRLLVAIKQDPNLMEIKSAALFGSYASGNQTPDSDIDVLMEFEPDATVGFFKLSDIKHNLESALKLPVDLLTPESISKYFRDEVLEQAEYIYEK